MIGVIANPVEQAVVREFFELFKTPWEFFREDRWYEVVLSAGDAKIDRVSAKLLLLYAGEKTACDAERNIEVQTQRDGTQLSLLGRPFPIYGKVVSFRHQGIGDLTENRSGNPIAYVDRPIGKMFARIGYDLFREVQFLLTKGQPTKNAGIPTLELHISFLRDLITGCGVSLVEIPPVPDGYSFIGCLTHDVDFSSIRGHKCDSTMFGFLYRATLGSVVDAVRGRLSLGKLFKNWAAAAKLPFVFLGLAADFWYEFDRCYLDMEKGRPSTFFVIPFARRPGRHSEGTAPRARGCRYDLCEIASKVPGLKAAGCEIGLHGIDAWLDSSSGRAEARRISEISATSDMGVRMHWLYSDEKSPLVLEEGGFSYDSSVGYNETVGYRAGTTQVFKPTLASRLLELPMHVMDTAMFYRSHLNLSLKDGWEAMYPILDNAVRHGGVLTINWHDRSIAPERLWGDFYELLVDEMATRGAWFSTAGQAVSWFRKRRSAVFESHGATLSVKVVGEDKEGLPSFRLRIHKGRCYRDTSFKGSINVPGSN